jgi:tetratricopeptide (TPR) repeat protein
MEMHARRVEASYRSLNANFPDEHSYREQLGHSLRHLLRVLQFTARYQQAGKVAGETLKVFEQLVAEFPEKPQYLQEVAFSQRELAGIMTLRGDWQAALDYRQQAVSLYRSLADNYPDNRFYREEISHSLSDVGWVLVQGRQYDKAAEAHRSSLNAWQQLVDDFPGRRPFRKQVADKHLELSHIFQLMGNREGAIGHAEASLAVIEKLASESDEYLANIAKLNLHFAGLLRADKPDEAERFYRRSAELFFNVADAPGSDPQYYQLAAQSYCELGHVLSGLDRMSDARQPYTDAAATSRHTIERYQLLVRQKPSREARYGLGDAYDWLGESLRCLDQATRHASISIRQTS